MHVRSRLESLVALGVLGCGLMAAPEASGSTLRLTSDQPIEIQAGESFSFDVFLDAEQSFAGFEFFLSVAEPEGSGKFDITGRVKPANNFDANNSNRDVTSTGPEGEDVSGDGERDSTLNPENDLDLGYTDEEFADNPAGTYEIATFTLTTDTSLENGTYTIFTTRGTIFTEAELSGQTETEGSPLGSGSIQVTVVPEPAGMGLLLLGGTALLARRRRA